MKLMLWVEGGSVSRGMGTGYVPTSGERNLNGNPDH